MTDLHHPESMAKLKVSDSKDCGPQNEAFLLKLQFLADAMGTMSPYQHQLIQAVQDNAS